MSSTVLRRLVAGAALAGCAVTATACQTNPTAAAIVGSTTISVDQLQAVVHRSLANPAAAQAASDRAAFVRQVLSRLIDAALLEDAARRRHITVTSAEVHARQAQLAQQFGGETALEQGAAQRGIAPADLPGYIRDIVLSNKLADAAVAGRQLLLVHSAHILVRTKALADRILAQVRRSPSSFATLARKDSIDTGSAPSGGDLGTVPPSQFVAPFAAAVTATPVGGFAEVHTQFGYHVVHVISRRSVSFAQADAATQQQFGSVRDAALAQILSQETRRLHVRVNSRFGAWDPKTGTVVAGKDTVSTSSPTPTPAGVVPGGPPQG